MKSMDLENIRLKLDPIVREIGVREVARRADIASATISNWLNGRDPMSLATLQKVAEACGYSLTARYILKRKRP